MIDSPGRIRKGLEKVSEVLWAIGLICLPLTSFPLFSSLSGGLVAPFSILPLFIVLIIWSIPLILRKGVLPKETTPLIIFIFLVILSCAAAYFFFIPGFKGKTVPGQEVRALFTLAVGLTFFMVTATWIKSNEKLNSSWKYLTIGGILAVLWAALQSIYILQHAEAYPDWMNRIQSALSILSPQYSPRYGRVNGLTYEASWFAHQMVILYLPLWLAATYRKTSAFRFRVLRISVENILLVAGLGVFFLSSPRIGLISFLLMILYLFIKLNLSMYRKVVEYFTKRQTPPQREVVKFRRTWIQVTTSLTFVVIYVLILGGVFFFAVQRDWRLGILISAPPTLKEIIGVLTLDQNTLLSLSHRFIFLERTIYWLSGWNVFNQYPWLGVGLGNSGFFFPQMAPAIGWATFEIRNVLFYLGQLPNVKSMWFRLLAETGLAGFAAFLAWFYTLFQSSRFSQHHQNTTIKTLGLAGQLALLAFIGEGFSIDSFAMPYLWVIAGFIAAIAMICRLEYSRNNHQAGVE